MMMSFDRISLGRQAKELGFVRDTFEKVCRLIDILKFFESDSLLSDALALKGGTAINLTIFQMPRLSVDIDLDYCKNVDKTTMLQERQNIAEHIQKYMSASGYNLSKKSKQYHALDSFVFEYTNAGGMKDNLKIEVNYMLRCHILPLSRQTVSLPWNIGNFNVLSVHPVELFSAKAVALFNRAAARDLYDMYNLQKYKIFTKADERLFKKCILFYFAIASESIPQNFEFSKIEAMTARKIKTDLLPVLNKSEQFDLPLAQTLVKEYLEYILLPEDDFQFWNAFRSGDYNPSLLFEDDEICLRIKDHPMALWKCNNNTTQG